VDAAWAGLSLTQTFLSEPAGARVTRAAVNDTTRWIPVGTTPTPPVRIPRNAWFYRYTLPGYRTVTVMGARLGGSYVPIPSPVPLRRVTDPDSDMVLLHGGRMAGTLFGRNHLRLVDVDGVEVDAIPQGHLLLVRNDDTPGVVGHLGQALGQRHINIARMTVGRKPGSGRAVMLIEVDNEVPADVLAEVTTVPGVREARALNLG